MVNRGVLAGEVLKATLHQEIFGQAVQNSFHFQAQSGSDTDQLLADVAGLPTGALQDATSRDLRVVNWTISDVVPGTHLSIEGGEYAGPLNVGTLAADSDVSFEAACIQWYTQLRGQGNRGRSYIAGMPHTVLEDGKLSAGEIGSLFTFAQLMLDTFNIGGPGSSPYRFGLWRAHLARVPVVGGQTALNITNPVVGHTDFKPRYAYPPTNKAVPLNPNAFLQIGSFTVGNRARSMRRRGIGVSITRSHRVARDD